MRLIAFLCLLAAYGFAHAADPIVRSVWFHSDLPQPVHRLPPDLRSVADRLPQWRAPGLEALGLWSMISAAPARFGLSQEQALALRDAINSRYLAIVRDPDMAGLQSAWPEAISTDPQRRGHYFLIQPADTDPELPVIVFLHGWGGNFLFYADFLKQALPGYRIVIPSYGLSWRQAPTAYLDEVLEHAENRLGTTITRPVLMTISAGGPAGFRAAIDNPTAYRCIISLATQPDAAQLDKIPAALPVLMLVGTNDRRFPIDGVQHAARRLDARLDNFQLTTLEADHFFLLTQPQATTTAISRWLADH